MSVQQPSTTTPTDTTPPIPEKPGTTRLAFIAVGSIIAIFGFITCLYAYKADIAGLEKLALMAAGSLISVISAVIGYIFGKAA